MRIHLGIYRQVYLNDQIYTFGGCLKHLIKRKHILSKRLKKAFQTQRPFNTINPTWVVEQTFLKPTSNRLVSIGYTDLVSKLKCPWCNRPSHEIQLFYLMP